MQYTSMANPEAGGGVVKCFAYLRVSGAAQIDGDGFERQLLACQAYAAANGYEIVEVFKEMGVSGTKELEDRPALSELLAALEENGIKVAICERLDRVARDLMVQETIISDMRKHGYTLISTAEPDLCSDDPSRVLIRQIFGALAQYDRAMITLKLRGARQRMKARTGRCEGVLPFGELLGEAPAMDEMRRLSIDHNAREIADYFNTNNIPSRSGKRWLPSVIRKRLARDKTRPTPASA
jgi:DNA invertase Pin-like site-specific DNA recombinase